MPDTGARLCYTHIFLELEYVSMCLAVPMKLVEITGEGVGKVDAGGVYTDVSLIMLPHVQVGDYLIVHAGFGIEVLDPEEANIRLDLFRELAAATSGETES